MSRVDPLPPCEILAKTGTAQPLVYYLHDDLSSTVGLTDFAGILVERYTYDVYGKPAFYNGSSALQARTNYGNRFLFTGREYLAELTLYGYRNRKYSAELGRWLERDPLESAELGQGADLYRYVGNSVASLTDPAGLAGWGGALSNLGSWIGGHDGDSNYDQSSGDSQQMSQSTIGKKLESFFTNKNSGKKCSDWAGVDDFKGSFGLSGLFGNMSNGTAEFVGSARGDASIQSVNCPSGALTGTVTASFKLTNVTSIRSLLYGVYPESWNVTTPGAPLSNWTQTYEWTKTFNCKCCSAN